MPTIGLEWVNKYHGRRPDLSNNRENARGFRDTLGATAVFESGDDAAADQDFEQAGAGVPSAGTDATHADAVDLTYFSGHGCIDGLIFGTANQDDGLAKPTELKLGDGSAKWIVFDACEVLQRDGLPVWYERLSDAFSGLHYILGFDTECGDVDDRGSTFAQRLNDGWSVRDAWMRACIETEHSGRRFAYVRALGDAGDSFDDHWFDEGFVSPDPDPATQRLFYFRSHC
jgi:hypothetical protein